MQFLRRARWRSFPLNPSFQVRGKVAEDCKSFSCTKYLDDADRPFEDGGLASTSKFCRNFLLGQINRDKLLPYVRPSVIVQPSSRNQTITLQIRILAVTMHTSGSEVAVFVHPIH